MKLTASIILVFACRVVLAAGPTDLEGRNDRGQRIRVIGESNGPMHSEIWIHEGKEERHLAEQKCGYSADAANFSCSSDGSSPLAGATFRFKPVSETPRTADCGRIAVCITGCNSRAPRELLESADECYDQGECRSLAMTESGSVHLREVNGLINAHNVNLRENPHSQSRVLRTVPEGVAVNALDHAGVCLLVDGKAGVWVRVAVLDDKAPSEGWIFDANVSYRAPLSAALGKAEQGVAADRREDAAPAER
jgi:hypothetical protein